MARSIHTEIPPVTNDISRSLVSRLAASAEVRAQTEALREVIGMEVRLLLIGEWPPHKADGECENAFCDVMIRAGRPCVACAHAEKQVERRKVAGPQSVTCLGGLCQTAVPLRIDGETFGFVKFGPLTLDEPSEEQFEQTLSMFDRWKIERDRDALRKALFNSPALSPKRHEAIVRVLIMFAGQASATALQFRAAGLDGESPAIVRGRQYIEEHKHEPVSLPEVARAAKVSASYFSRMFKKATAQSFTDYLARIRIEQAQQLLRNPEMRVGEVAYAVGFQSIPHFNRVFKKLAGESPTQFRTGNREPQRPRSDRSIQA